MGNKPSMPKSAAEAPPGREAAVQINNKHYILGTQMKGFEPPLQTIVLGTGCFWGTEKGFWRLPNVHSTAVGYAGGFTPNASYEEVCSGATGHNEVVQVAYDPSKISLVDILRQFWQSHDPSQGMGQGNDRGTQYRSSIFFTTEEQRELAEASLEAYQGALGSGRTITTEILGGVQFYYAEDYHQQYLGKPGSRPYCSAQPLQISLPPFEEWAPAALKDAHAPKLGEDYWELHAPSPHCVLREPNEPIKWPPYKLKL